MENRYSNTRGVIPRSSLGRCSRSTISPSIVWVLPLPVCRHVHNSRHKCHRSATSLVDLKNFHDSPNLKSLSSRHTVFNGAGRNKSLQKGRENKPYLAITEHTTIVSSHAVFDHGHASHSEKFLLQQIRQQHILSSLLTFSVVMLGSVGET